MRNGTHAGREAASLAAEIANYENRPERFEAAALENVGAEPETALVFAVLAVSQRLGELTRDLGERA